MVLLFRALWLFLTGLFRRRAGLLDDSVLRFRAWPTDIDLNRHLNDGRYVSLAGLGRVYLLVRSGVFREALQRHWYPVVGAVTIRYRREIPALRRFTLRTRVAGWDEKWFYFEQRFELDGTLAAIVWARGLVRTRKGAVPTSDLLTLAGVSVPSPSLPDGLVRWSEGGIP
jgi:acyl-CoA thioesterase FadM